MSARLLHPDEYELDTRSSVDSQGTFNLDEADFESQAPPRPRRLLNRFSFLSWLFSSTSSGYRRLKPSRRILSASSRPSCYRRLLLRRSCFYIHVIIGIVLARLQSFVHPILTRRRITQSSGMQSRNRLGRAEATFAMRKSSWLRAYTTATEI